MSITNFAPLFKRTANGAVQVWTVQVDPHDDGTASIVIKHGKLDGVMQEVVEHIKQGKNPGKRNATTPVQQAIKEAEARWTRQRDRRHYGETLDESDSKISIAPMLAHKFAEHHHKVNWKDRENIFIQPKFDGHRCLAFVDSKMNIKLYTRKGVEITSVPHIVKQLSAAPPNSIIDGELYMHGAHVTQIGSLITRKQEASKDLCYIVYDVVDANKPFRERFKTLAEDCVQFDDETHINLARTINIGSMEEAYEFQQIAISHGYEGAMLRHGTATYRAGKRSDSLLKLKTFIEDDFLIVGCRHGKVEDEAIFVCLTDAGHPFDITAPGTVEDRREYWSNQQQYIGKKLSVSYVGYTDTAEPVPFHATAIKIADGL